MIKIEQEELDKYFGESISALSEDNFEPQNLVEFTGLEVNSHKIDIEIRGSRATGEFGQKVIDTIMELDNQSTLGEFA